MGNSFRRLLSVLTYFCMVYGILIGMLMTFGVKKPTLTILNNDNIAQNTGKFSDEALKNLENNGIFVETIKPYDVVSSPLDVSGWVAKSTFPNENFNAILVDDNGQILAVATVTSQPDGSVVNFATKLEFGTATDEEGNIFFEDVNQISEENAEIISYRMPVKFAQIQAPTDAEEETNLDTSLEEPTVAGYETQYWGQQDE